MRKLRFLLGVLLILGMASSVMAANFYWKTTLAALTAVPGAVDGDRAIVIGPAGDVTFYLRTGGLWIPATTSTSWSLITDRPTFGGAPLTGAMLDNVLNYPTFNQDTTGNAATATTLSGAVSWGNIMNKPTIGGVEITGATLDNSGLYPILNQSTIGNAATATTADSLSAQYIDWSQSSGATSVANRPTINGVTVTGSVLDNASNYPAVVGATTDRFLKMTGTTGATLGLWDNCASNEIPKWNGTAWTCAADTQSAGDNPVFDNVQSGTNTSSTMTVGTGGTLTYSGSGVVNASQYHGITAIDNNEFFYLDGVTANIQGQLDNVLVFGSDTRGDLAVRGASAYGRLGIGSAGKILGTDGTDPSWSAYTLAAPGAVGAVLYSNGTNWIRSAAPAISAATMTSFPTLNQNTTGTAANLSGTPALPNGTTATTQSANDNSTKLSTTAYVDAAFNNVAIADNTIVNADINSAAAIDASKIGGGGVSTTEYDYLSEVTSDIQGQIDGKQASSSMLSNLSSNTVQDNVTVYDDKYVRFGTDNDFTVQYKSADATLVIALDNGDAMCTFSKTGNLSCTGEITAGQYDSSGMDNTYGINVMNTADPTGAYLEGGLQWVTDNCVKVRSSDNTVTFSAGCLVKTFAFGIDNVIASDDILLWKVPRASTILQVDCYASTDSVVGVLSECTAADVTSCTAVDSTDWTVTNATGGFSVNSGFENDGLAAGAWLKWVTTSVGTTNSNKLSCTVKYRE